MTLNKNNSKKNKNQKKYKTFIENNSDDSETKEVPIYIPVSIDKQDNIKDKEPNDDIIIDDEDIIMNDEEQYNQDQIIDDDDDDDSDENQFKNNNINKFIFNKIFNKNNY